MELLTTSEMAKKWDISRRRVTTLCAEGRIEGAILKGNTWLIPENAENQMIQDESVKLNRRNVSIVNEVYLGLRER